MKEIIMKKLDLHTGNLMTCVFEILIGILLLINPVGFTSGIIIAFGLFLTAAGIISVIKYFRTDAETASKENGLDMLRIKQQYWYIGCISAAVTAACAVLILVNPFTAAASLWIFIGVTMIAETGLDIVTLYFWKK